MFWEEKQKMNDEPSSRSPPGVRERRRDVLARQAVICMVNQGNPGFENALLYTASVTSGEQGVEIRFRSGYRTV